MIENSFYKNNSVYVILGTNWLIVTLAMIGKLAITASYGTIYIFSTEQFPTVIRNAGLGAGSMSARLGSVFAPLINETVSDEVYL